MNDRFYREAIRDKRQKDVDRMRRRRGTDLRPRTCFACGIRFTPSRTHARCCSGKCRARLSRNAKSRQPQNLDHSLALHHFQQEELKIMNETIDSSRQAGPCDAASQIIELAKSEVNKGNPAQAITLIECAIRLIDQQRQGWPSEADRPWVERDQAIQPQPELPVSRLNDVYVCICKFLRDRRVGLEFSFTQVADFIETQDSLNLDRTLTPTERRERWRNHVSRSFEKLVQYGCIRRHGKNSHYLLLQHP